MSRSSKLFERAKQKVPGGVNSPVRAFAPFPFFTASGKGCRIKDVDGKEYIDYCLAYGPLILGHANPEILDAVEQQIRDGTIYGTPTEQEVELAEQICSLVPSAEMTRLVTTGAEATMSAIRAARAYTGRKKIVKFEGCYHGAHDAVLVKAGSGATTFGVPDSLGIPSETTQNTLICPFNNPDKLDALVKQERKDLAAVIMEPVIGNIGVVLPKKGYLEEVRELTENHDVVLIFDEVITGFRLALGGAQEFFNVKPDMTTLGKILGGGFPLAAFTGQEEIMKTIAPAGKAYQAGTYSGNPVSVTASLATLQVIETKGQKFYDDLTAKREMLTHGLADAAAARNIPVQVNGIASMFQMFLSKKPVIDYQTAKASDAKRFMTYHTKLLENGVFTPPSQFETCFISNQHTEREITTTIEAAQEALDQI